MKTIIIFLLLSTPVYAQDWTKQDTITEGVYLALHAIDYFQTKEIARNPAFKEYNPILGEHPSSGRINTYFALTAIGHAAISYVLKPKYRRYWQFVTIGIQSYTVCHNYHVGVRFSF